MACKCFLELLKAVTALKILGRTAAGTEDLAEHEVSISACFSAPLPDTLVNRACWSC